jgi:hypothetical protein
VGAARRRRPVRPNRRAAATDVRETVAAYRALGAHEVMLSCWSDDIEQVDRLADLLA